MITLESLGAVSYSPSIVTVALSCISSEIKPDWSKIVIFYTPFHSTPLQLGWSPSEYCHLPSRLVWKNQSDVVTRW